MQTPALPLTTGPQAPHGGCKEHVVTVSKALRTTLRGAGSSDSHHHCDSITPSRQPGSADAGGTSWAVTSETLSPQPDPRTTRGAMSPVAPCPRVWVKQPEAG